MSGAARWREGGFISRMSNVVWSIWILILSPVWLLLVAFLLWVLTRVVSKAIYRSKCEEMQKENRGERQEP